jgi:TolA-binding protein
MPPSPHGAPRPAAHASVPLRPIPAGHALLRGRPPARVVIRTNVPARRSIQPGPVAAPEVDPEAADLLSAGQTFYHSGDFEQARDAFKQALRVDEAGGESRFWLAMAYAHEGKSWRSCHQFREYASHFPEGARAGYVSARIADCGG